MWNPFKRPEPVVFRTKSIDWSKVKTVDDVIFILSHLQLTSVIPVDESEWNDPEISRLLGTTITEKIYRGYDIEYREIEE